MLYEQPQLYDQIYDRFDEDVRFYADIAGGAAGPICEHACGTGRISVPLAAAGHTVHGYDAAAPMLSRARKRAAAAGASRSLVLHQGDMRRIPDEAPFGLVIIGLHSLSHMHSAEDIGAVLDAAFKSLAPGGLLAIALHNPSVAYALAGDSPLQRIHGHLSDSTVYESTRYESHTQMLRLKWYVETSEATEMLEYSLRMIFPAEALMLVRAAGFQVEAQYGWYDRSPFQSDSGTHILLARRAE